MNYSRKEYEKMVRLYVRCSDKVKKAIIAQLDRPDTRFVVLSTARRNGYTGSMSARLTPAAHGPHKGGVHV